MAQGRVAAWTLATAAATSAGMLVLIATDMLSLRRLDPLGLVTNATGILLVGLAQAALLPRVFPGVSRRAWVVATLAAALAVALLAALGDEATRAAGTLEAALAVAVVLAALTGVVVGAAQARVLGPRPGRVAWVGANAAAWFLAALASSVSAFFVMGAFSTPADPALFRSQMVVVSLVAAVLEGLVLGLGTGLALRRVAAPPAPPEPALPVA